MKNKAKKNMDESADIIKSIPQTFKESCTNKEINDLIDEFENATSIEQQITIIHSFSAHLAPSVRSIEKTPTVVHILTHLFVTVNPKHPIKKSILRAFANRTDLNLPISVVLSRKLLEKIEKVFYLEDQTNCVNSIIDCFNNCPVSVSAVSIVLHKIYPFLIDTLNSYLNMLREITSPVTLQEYYKHIHNCTRAMLAVLQQCDQPITFSPAEYNPDILKICVTVLNNPDMLYDSKNNCGIILIITFHDYSNLLKVALRETTSTSTWNDLFNDFKDDIILTCLLNGILNTAPPNRLCRFKDSFEQSDIYKITNKLLEISKNSADKPSTILGVSRTLLQASRNLLSLNDENLMKILSNLLDHVWTQLDHYVDTIRHVSKQILLNLVRLSMQRCQVCLKNTPLVIIINSVLNTPVFRNSRYVAFSIIGDEVGVEMLLSKDSNLVKKLLKYTEDSSIASYVTSCYENLMRCHLKETDEESWFKTWVIPLTSKLAQEVELDEKGSCYQRLLISAIKLRPSILNSILARWSTDNELQFSSLLKCTLIARKIGADLKDDTKWRGMLDGSILELASCHQNDEIRISSLSLIAESHKSTEIFNEWELKFVVKFLQYNINTQLPATRQRILFLLKKVLTRFSESYYAIIRNYTKINERSQKNSQLDVLKQQKCIYESFLFNLRECIFDSLFPGANFSRRIICLELLTSLEPIITEVLKVLNDPALKLWKQSEVDSLLLCLSDSYESNKQLATNMLKNCPVELLKLHTVDNTNEFIDNALKFARSVKPADTVTAAYMFEISMYSSVITEVLTQSSDIYSPEYLMINLLLNNLKEQIEIGRNSLLKAAGSAPMHGTLFCIRHLMEKYLSASTMFNSHWKYLLEDIITTCFKVSEIVCPVVNSSSPEGHLPMDHETVAEDAEDSEESEEVITAQMLLVCSWRSIKEVSLLLGEITLKSRIVGQDPNSFITEEQMLKIGEHFTVLLTETKHRGAFEQAYVGFTKLCNRLWRCKDGTLHEMPVTWLKEIITAISEGNSSNSKLCATRRSAGVPFMIQAIIVSELQTGGSTHFHKCMKILLQFANHIDDNINTRTHSMNILRALYRHAQLGDDICPYVAEGVIASITGFTRNNWAERNSATLLFSSLMTRIFGVQRTRDTELLNIRNKMTARVFFLRYPSLHPFFFNLLQELTNENCEKYKEVALYPILLILARLYPANSDEIDSNKQLQDFIPFVRICAKNRTLQTRELAAKALVPLVQTQFRADLLKELFELLKRREENKNFIHGTLLQIFNLLKTVTINDVNYTKEIKDSLWLITCTSEDCCPIIAALYMQIISKIFSRQDSKICCSISEDIFSVISFQNNYVQNNCTVGKTEYYRESINLQLKLLIHELNAQKICEFLLKNLVHENLNVKEFILNFIICILRNPETAFHVDNLEVEQEKLLMNFISKEFKNDLILNIKHESQKFNDSLQLIIDNNNNLLSKALFVLFQLKETDYFYYLETYFGDQEIMSAVMSCFPSVLQKKILTRDLAPFLKIILEAATPNYNLSCRYYSALTLLEMKPLLFGDINIDFENLLLLWRAVMILLGDIEPVVRNTISKLSNNAPVAEKAREELLSKCIDLVKNISEEKCISLLLFWSLTMFDFEDSDDDLELQIFERGEISTYIEDMCLSKISAKSLTNLINCNNVSNIPDVFTKIIMILKQDEHLWETNTIDRDILIKVLEEIPQERNIKNYFECAVLDVFYKYKILNILKAILPDGVLNE